MGGGITYAIITEAINLSILDFKSDLYAQIGFCTDTINLSILDFKSLQIISKQRN